MLKLRILTTASALALSSGSAGAQELYGTGALDPAEVFRQAADCYGASTPLVIKFPPSVPPPYPIFATVPPATIPGGGGSTCATVKVDPTTTIVYVASSSNDGVRAIYRNDGVTADDYLPETGVQFFPQLHFGVSETVLTPAELGAYNSGGTVRLVTVVQPGVMPDVGVFKNPRKYYGPLVQIPLMISPVAIAYDPVYKRVREIDSSGDERINEFTFNIRFPATDGSGGLRLDASTYCGIFNGQITNWNDRAIRELNGFRYLRDPDDDADGDGRVTPDASDPEYAEDDIAFSPPLQIVGHRGAAAVNEVWTRHLATICAGSPGNQYFGSAATLPVALQGATYTFTPPEPGEPPEPNDPPPNELLGRYTLAGGSDNVARYIEFSRQPPLELGWTVTQGRLGYLGPNFVLPAVLNTERNTFGLHTATLKNRDAQFVRPTPDAAVAAFEGSVSPPRQSAKRALRPGVPRSARPGRSGRLDRGSRLDAGEPAGVSHCRHGQLARLHLLCGRRRRRRSSRVLEVLLPTKEEDRDQRSRGGAVGEVGLRPLA